MRIGADVGGTFTDVILDEGNGQTSIVKRLSTPPDYDLAVVEAISDLTSERRFATGIDEVVHGTTVATNAVLERRGSRTALVTTAGFRDVLELRRLRTPQMYDLFWKKPPPMVDRQLRYEVDERVRADGRVERPVNEAEVRRLAGVLRDSRVEAVAVCLLHSYLHPAHEVAVGTILREELPEVAISLSSEILREQGEYERSATTAVNAYVRPTMASYLRRIRKGLDRLGIEGPLMIMQSSGGIMTASDSAERPVFALESGPAAGVVAALATSEHLGIPNVISFDMGGTTAKASLIENGALSRSREYEAGGSVSAGSRLLRGSGELLRIPAIDISEVGAGGGSIAWIDSAGGFQVGPVSAGAAPGPACYGRGGTKPTVTDANVVLGYIPEGPIADGEIVVSRERAEEAIAREIAEPLGLTVVAAAQGIHGLANARMMRALRSVSSERGRDPREFALIAYGGSGPVHAVGLADDLNVSTVVIPPLAGFFSAVGLLFARPEFHDVRTCQLEVDVANLDAIRSLYAEMHESLGERMAGRGRVEWEKTADLRYLGQSWEVEVALPEDEIDAEALFALASRFEDEHERLYGVRGQEGATIQIRAVRLAAIAEPERQRPFLSRPPLAPSTAGTRFAYFRDDGAETSIYARADISTAPHQGPLLVDEYDTTVVVPPHWTIRRDVKHQSLILEREA